MQVYNLNDYTDTSELDQFCQKMTWYQGIPGGFGTNAPKRKVNTFGNGATIDNNGAFSSEGIQSTYWTAMIKANQYTLKTKTSSMPDVFTKLIPIFRHLFRKTFPDAIITDNTFNIAVCNYYNNYDSYIAAHTDDNVWYPHECSQGAVFASLTLYPEGESCPLSRFQIKNTSWDTIDLHHHSLMIMPSNIMHRVLPCQKKHKDSFKPRINITFRSTFAFNQNPLLHTMAVANHNRYYKPPYKLITPSLTSDSFVEILEIFNTWLSQNKKPVLKISERNPSILRSTEIQKYKQKYPISHRISNNMVVELFLYLNKSL